MEKLQFNPNVVFEPIKLLILETSDNLYKFLTVIEDLFGSTSSYITSNLIEIITHCQGILVISTLSLIPLIRAISVDDVTISIGKLPQYRNLSHPLQLSFLLLCKKENFSAAKFISQISVREN